MKEACYLCGHSWGVTTSPRGRVLCTPCARPTPNRQAARYWWLRAWTGWDYRLYRSPEWWDQQTALQDLKYAAEVAASCGRPATDQEGPAVPIPAHHRAQLAGYLACDGIRLVDDPDNPRTHLIHHRGADWTAAYWGHLAGEPVWRLTGPGHPHGIDLDVIGIHNAITKHQPEEEQQ